MRLKLLLLITIFMLFGTTVINAVSTDILVDIVPPNPAPNENVTINLKSYAYDLNSVLISWSINGKVSASGIGKKSFSTVAGKAGEEKNVVVTISLPDGTTDTKITIKPSVMVLLWQANDSFVPPFYKGKTQPKILFYKNDTTLGIIWEKTLANPHKMVEKEIVEAIPYFISPKELLTPTLVWNWFINDNRVTLTSLKKNSMPLQVKSGTHGTSKLRLNIENTDKIFESANKEINIEF